MTHIVQQRFADNMLPASLQKTSTITCRALSNQVSQETKFYAVWRHNRSLCTFASVLLRAAVFKRCSLQSTLHIEDTIIQ